MSNNRRALLLSVFVGTLCLISMITLFTWPPFVAGSWALTQAPAWWQLEMFSSIGVALSTLPSLVVFTLDGFFQSHSTLRVPFTAVLVSAEIVLDCYAVYRAMLASLSRRK